MEDDSNGGLCNHSFVFFITFNPSNSDETLISTNPHPTPNQVSLTEKTVEMT